MPTNSLSISQPRAFRKVSIMIERPITPQKEKFQARYRMIKWWARKPWWVIREYIEHFTKPGEIVLDPFCGSGVVLNESLILRRRAIGIDFNPMATLITKESCMPTNVNELSVTFKKLEEKVEKEIEELYSRPCSKCKTTTSVSKLLWKDSIPTYVYYYCFHCKSWFKEEVCDEDIKKIKETNSMEIPYWYPKEILLPSDADVEMVEDLYTRRNLIALSILYNRIESIPEESIRETMKFTFCAMLPQATKMIMRLDTRGMGSWVIHRYWIPKEHFEMNVWHFFKNRYKKTLKGKEQINSMIGDYFKEGVINAKTNNTCWILAKSSRKLPEIQDASVDYVFTDPPYGASIQYLRLCTMWNAWLKNKVDEKEEIVVNRGKNHQFYQKMLTHVLKEVHRILKDERYMSMTFHNRDIKVWNALLEACRDSGFKLLKAIPEKPQAPSVSQIMQEKSLKSDLILTFIKMPEPIKEIISKEMDVNQIIAETINEVVSGDNGATTTEIYDKLVPVMYELNLLDETTTDIMVLLSNNFEFSRGRWYTKNASKRKL